MSGVTDVNSPMLAVDNVISGTEEKQKVVGPIALQQQESQIDSETNLGKSGGAEQQANDATNVEVPQTSERDKEKMPSQTDKNTDPASN